MWFCLWYAAAVVYTWPNCYAAIVTATNIGLSYVNAQLTGDWNGCYVCMYGEKRTQSGRDTSHFPDSNRTLTVGKSPCLAAICRGTNPSCICRWRPKVEPSHLHQSAYGSDCLLFIYAQSCKHAHTCMHTQTYTVHTHRKSICTVLYMHILTLFLPFTLTPRSFTR